VGAEEAPWGPQRKQPSSGESGGSLCLRDSVPRTLERSRRASKKIKKSSLEKICHNSIRK
jgi:hypothetical protein